MRAAVPPVALQSPDVSGGAPHFSAKLGGWVTPLRQDRTQLQRSRSKRRPGNLTHSQRVKVWLAIIIYCAAVWSAGAWVWCSYYGAGR